MILLPGPTAESELTKLKSLIEPFLKPKSLLLPQSQPSSKASGAGPPVDHSTRSTKSQNIIRQATQLHENEQLLRLQRKKLLASNQLLAKQFHELVIFLAIHRLLCMSATFLSISFTQGGAKQSNFRK